eukprot:3878380-Pleurochrysis_carterae.AAC.1
MQMLVRSAKGVDTCMDTCMPSANACGQPLCVRAGPVRAGRPCACVRASSPCPIEGDVACAASPMMARRSVELRAHARGSKSSRARGSERGERQRVV